MPWRNTCGLWRVRPWAAFSVKPAGIAGKCTQIALQISRLCCSAGWRARRLLNTRMHQNLCLEPLEDPLERLLLYTERESGAGSGAERSSTKISRSLSV